MAYEFTGEIIHIGDRQEFASGFYKRDIVLTDRADKYPQQIPFECVKQTADLIDSKGLRVGDRVTVRFDLRGREYKGRYFGSNNVWKLDRLGEPRQKPQHDEAQRQLNHQQETLDDDAAFSSEPPF